MEQRKRGATYLAWVDGEPAARAYAADTDHGLVLFGGATLPEAAAAALTAPSCARADRTPSPAPILATLDTGL